MKREPSDRVNRHPGSWEVILIVALVIVMIFILYPVFAPRHYPARQTTCTNNVRQQLLAVQIYMQDHKNMLPKKDSAWQDINVRPDALVCPTYGKQHGNGYGYNMYIGGRILDEQGMPKPHLLLILADSNAPGNLLNSPTDIDFRHTKKAVVGYADGHVTLQAPSAIPKLQPENKQENLTDNTNEKP
jgi:prepilin-type processing-associated H-X9-DG protein